MLLNNLGRRWTMDGETLPEVPHPIICVIDEETPHLILDEFFSSVLTYLGYPAELFRHAGQLKYRQFADSSSGLAELKKEWIVMLMVCDIMVASVIFEQIATDRVRVVYSHHLDGETVHFAQWCHGPVECSI